MPVARSSSSGSRSSRRRGSRSGGRRSRAVSAEKVPSMRAVAFAARNSHERGAIRPRARQRLPGSVKWCRSPACAAITSATGGESSGPSFTRAVIALHDEIVRAVPDVAVHPAVEVGVALAPVVPLHPAPAVHLDAPIADAVVAGEAQIRVRAHDLRVARAVRVQPLRQRRERRRVACEREAPLDLRAVRGDARRACARARSRRPPRGSRALRARTKHSPRARPASPRRARARGRTRPPTPPRPRAGSRAVAGSSP